ncbi:hypothetical protein DM02DRAFT_620482 [Periconia macrospinosa]|uniref:Uncharacterized protein n=1 Tax=Periconia macrospinosa TaxID=97972 RepID=A0A2V1D1M6_9PLEO|nr:hypothetical protein DM02DRAFT_620482 [Periconia macrospinosa]
MDVTDQANTQGDAQAVEQTTVYDVWQQADGLHDGEKHAKWITFKDGFVRVRGMDRATVEEGWAKETERKFYVAPWHSCEVLGAEIKFTKA